MRPRKVVQVWECPNCKAQYESPVMAAMVACNSKHKQRTMKLIVGELPKPHRKRELQRPVRSVPVSREDWEEEPKRRVKATRVTDPELLLQAFGINKDKG
jgi:hypothetical protein